MRPAAGGRGKRSTPARVGIAERPRRLAIPTDSRYLLARSPVRDDDSRSHGVGAPADEGEERGETADPRVALPDANDDPASAGLLLQVPLVLLEIVVGSHEGFCHCGGNLMPVSAIDIGRSVVLYSGASRAGWAMIHELRSWGVKR